MSFKISVHSVGQAGIKFVIRLSDNQVTGLLVSATISN